MSVFQFDHFLIRHVGIDDLQGHFNLIDRNRKRLETFFAGTVAATMNLEAAKVHLADVMEKNGKKQLYWFVVIDEDTKAMIGSVQLKSFDWNSSKAEVGYYIDSAYEGKGIVRKAVSHVVAYGFDTLGLNKIFLRAHPSNTASVKVAEKNGFQVEGLLRQDYRTTEGTLVDLVYFGLINPANKSQAFTS